jgi:hypothetical protein
MTMIMTMIRPEGIWQSADYRVTRGGQLVDDATPKQLHIMYPPLPGGPQVLLAFTGLAEFPDGTPTLQWIRETLRGDDRPILEIFNHLRDRLTRDVGSSRLWKNPLILSGGIFEGKKRGYVEFRNIDLKTRTPIHEFEYVIFEVEEPVVLIGGSGWDYVAKEDKDLLANQVKIRPAKWEDHLGLLAGVNRRTARNRKSGVSPWCQASFLSNETQGAKTKRFAKPGEPEGPLGMELIMVGIDMFETTKNLMEHLQKMRKDPTTPMPDMTDAGHRAVKGRK